MQTVVTRNTFIEVVDHLPEAAQLGGGRRRLYSCPGYLEQYSSDWDTSSTAASQDSTIPPTDCSHEPKNKHPSGSDGRTSGVLSVGIPSKSDVDVACRIGFQITNRCQPLPVSEKRIPIGMPPVQPQATSVFSDTMNISKYHVQTRKSLNSIECISPRELYLGGLSAVQASSKAGVDRNGTRNNKKVFIGGLKQSTEQASLRQYFSRFGSIVSCGIVKDYKGMSKRFGYCEFSNESSVTKLLSRAKHEVDGVTVSVRLYCLRD